jgi:PAS domain S-box-containing protein
MKAALKILMLEDNINDAEIVERLLTRERLNFEFRLAQNRQAFLFELEQFAPDLILADNSLPQFNAAEALEIVQEKSLTIPFIMVTGSVSEEFAADMIRSGVDDYIIKDRLARLPAAIDAALKQRKLREQRLEAVQSLTLNEEKYRSLVERVSDGFIALDLNAEFIYVNEKAEKLFDKAPDYLLGKNMWEEFPETIDTPFHLAYCKSLVTGENMRIEEYSLVLKRWVEINIYSSSSGVSFYFRDLTEQRRAELKVKESEERYRIFIERITDAFIALDRNWCYTYLNKQAGELIHRDPESMIGKNVWEEFPDAVGSATYVAFNKALKEQSYEINTDYFEPLNLWQENHIYPSPDGLSIFIKDITLERKAEEQKALLASIVNFSDDAIISKTMEGTITSWNLGAERLFGYTSAEILNKNISLLIPPDRVKEEPEIMDKIRKGIHVDHYETQRIRKDGSSVYVALSISPIQEYKETSSGLQKSPEILASEKAPKTRRSLIARTFLP